MNTFLLIVGCLICSGMTVGKQNQFMPDYMARDRTVAIKGIFTILILFSHYAQYVELGGYYDAAYLALREHLNQMVVSMFFFYSGYGMMEMIRKQGSRYIFSIPGKRFLNVLVHMDIAVCLFLVVNAMMGRIYGGKTILLSLIGWSSVGNSNWYIFAILVIYLLVFVSFLHYKKLDSQGGQILGCVILTILTVGFVYFQMRMGRPDYCYNTIILFPAGCWYSLVRPYTDRLLMRNDFIYAVFCLIAVLGYCGSFFCRRNGIEWYTLWGVFFTALILLFTMKIQIHNPVIEWFGNHVFSVYILQRIPMMILDHFHVTPHKYMFLVISIIATIILATAFDSVMSKFEIDLSPGRRNRRKS